MPKFNFVLLYVANPLASATFYEALLGRPPVEASPSFVMMPLSETVMLGLWSAATVVPAPGAKAGAGEVAFTVADAAAVDAAHAAWERKDVPILQAPVDMDFGRTFVAMDPDGHRIRVLAPAM